MHSNQNRFIRVILALLIFTFFIFPIQSMGVVGIWDSTVYAEPYHSFEVLVNGGGNVSQGESAVVDFTITNLGPEVIIDQIILEYSPWVGIKIEDKDPATYVLSTGETTICSFSITIAKDAPTGVRYGNVTLSYQDRILYQTQKGNLTITKGSSGDDETSNEPLEVSISYTQKPTDGFTPGNNNEISFELINSGDFSWENTYAELSLPGGFGIYNSTKANRIGMLYKGTRTNIMFPIYMEEDFKGNFCSLGLTLTGQKSNGQSVSLKKTFYVPVKQKSESANITENFVINNVEIPSQAEAKENFKMTFEVVNKGSKSAKNVRVSCEMPTGLLNKTRNNFVESTFEAGGKRQYSVTLYTDVEETKSFPIKIMVESLDGEDAGTVSQYTNVFVKKAKDKSDVKTPQLMVTSYSYGGSYVQARSKFRLNLTLQNTSGQDLSNIKVALGSDGTFIPVNSSNSFFIESIGKKGQADYSVMLSVKPDAKQETSAIEINMSYEDGDKEFTSKDTIAIPVMQESRLSVDDIMQPMELYVGNPAGVSVQFYNMGKTTLNNLRASAYGDFDTPESINYFVGNMEPGKSDSYDFALIPRQQGLMKGAVVFTYEDVGGKAQTYEVPFEFQVMGEMPVFDPNPMEPKEAQKKGADKWVWIVSGVTVIGIGAGIFIKKRRRKKKQMELEAEE